MSESFTDIPIYNTMDNRDIAVLALSFILVFAVVSMRSLIPSNLKSVFIFLFPFCGILYVCRGKLNLIVKRLHKIDLVYIFVYVVFYYMLSMGAGAVLYYLGFPLKPNAVLNMDKDAVFWILFFVQILGEELFKLSVFITALSLLYKYASKIDYCMIAISMILTSVLFGAIHMFAYSSLLQPLLILGLGNLVLIFAYVQSKNILIPYVSHLIVDLIPLMATMYLLI